MKISFLGDISLNDNYIELYKKGIDPFKEVEPLLSSCDYVVGNLECMAKGELGENLLKQPRLTTTVETLNYLKNIHLKVASLAQNHVYDHLEDGFNKTTQFLDDNAILHTGAAHSIEEASMPAIITKNGISIALLNYVTKDTNPNLPPDAKIYLNIFDLEKCKQDIEKLKQKVNHIVLLLHWGGRVEGGLFPDWDQPKIARELIDAGADLIVGHHSHTIQPFEIYKGKYIFYSLGNFCFSDYWFNDELNIMTKRRMRSIIIQVDFSQIGYQLQEDYFINTIDRFIKYDAYKNKIRFRNRIFKILMRTKMGWNIYFFHKQFLLPLVLFLNRKDLSYPIKTKRIFRYIVKKR